ncbi:MAG: ABC transporter ATP-binding protein [Acidimicrobiia bacterium]
MAEITIQGATKRYPDGTEAVKDVNIDIADGEFVILVGPSGCGKSTLLRMIVGLEDISDGEIRIGGTLVNDKPPRERNLAMVFQNYALYPHLTVRENMAFPLRLANTPAEEVNRRVEEAAKILELTDHLDRKPANLSGGQRQRVAMGRAIVREPAAFLLDEPLSNLDAKLRVQMRTEIARLQNRLKTTTVYVTHDQTEAMTLGDRVAVLRKGVVQQVASPRELYQDPVNLFVAGFIGSPAMNFLPAEVQGDEVKLPMASFPLPDRARQGVGERTKLIAGIRPEDFEDCSITTELPPTAARFRAGIEVIEWMGSELYAYFRVGRGEHAGTLAELAQELETVETPGGEDMVVARLDAASDAREGHDAELWFNPERVHLFDPESGMNLTRRDGGNGAAR